MHSHYTEVFANLPTTPAALSDDVTNDVAERWFSSAELRSLNVSHPADFLFISELYMMQEIITAVCFVIIYFVEWVCEGNLASRNSNLCTS